MRSCTHPHNHSYRSSSTLSVVLFASIYCMAVATALFAQAPASQTQERELAATLAKATAVRAKFEQGTHGWIFIHELGHWWQACRNVSFNRDHYQVEYGADRISLAYWREVDPNVVGTMMPIFQNVLANAPNPVPAGEDVETYFNKHYEELGPSPAYPWFQSRMNVAAYEEEPAPTFAQTLLSVPGN